MCLMIFRLFDQLSPLLGIQRRVTPLRSAIDCAIDANGRSGRDGREWDFERVVVSRRG